MLFLCSSSGQPASQSLLVLVPGRRRQLPPFGRRRRWAGGGAPLLGLRLGSEPAWPKCSKTQWKCILFWAYHSVTISDLGVPFSHVSRKNIFQSLEKRSFTGEILQFTRAGNYTQKPLQNAYGLHDFLTISLKKAWIHTRITLFSERDSRTSGK